MFIDINPKRSINVNHVVSVDIVESSFQVDTPFSIRVTLINREQEILGPWASIESAHHAKAELMGQVRKVKD